jgi:hypothetical protein
MAEMAGRGSVRMRIGNVAVIPVLLAALGAARSADARGADAAPVSPVPIVISWDQTRRDPLECWVPKDDFPKPPPANAAELVRQAAEQLALGNISETERLIGETSDALRVQGAGDQEVETQLRSLREEIASTRTVVDAVEQFRKLELSLSGIAWSRSNPVALVNDMACVPGDIVEDARIVSILPVEVVFEFNGVRVRKSVLHPGVERVEDSGAAGEPGERE